MRNKEGVPYDGVNPEYVCQGDECRHVEVRGDEVRCSRCKRAVFKRKDYRDPRRGLMKHLRKGLQTPRPADACDCLAVPPPVPPVCLAARRFAQCCFREQKRKKGRKEESKKPVHQEEEALGPGRLVTEIISQVPKR